MEKIRRDKTKQGKPKIAVIGASNIDLVVRTLRFPVPGETVFGEDFFMVPGGKGANQAVAAAKLGAEVLFISRVGRDLFGDKIIGSLDKEGVRTDCIVRDPRRPSGVALIVVEKNGENAIVVTPGANAGLNKRDIDQNESAIISADILVLQLETPLAASEHAITLARKKRIPIILNPAPAVGKLPPGLLNKIDIITPNETELQKLTGGKINCPGAVRTAADKLLEQGVGTVVVTMGKKGALLVRRDFAELIPAKKVKAVDTTAAGDAFTGALSFALAKGTGIRKAAAFANCVAALSVTRMGAQSSMPTMAEVKKF
jgi:ribokinase